MIYKIRLAHINNDGTLTEGKRTDTIFWRDCLQIGGLYFLRPGKLYRIISKEEATV